MPNPLDIELEMNSTSPSHQLMSQPLWMHSISDDDGFPEILIDAGTKPPSQ